MKMVQAFVAMLFDSLDDLLDEFGEAELLEMMLEELVEEFEWEISNEILFIDFPSVGSFGVANEEWNAVIEGDVLTIDGRERRNGI